MPATEFLDADVDCRGGSRRVRFGGYLRDASNAAAAAVTDRTAETLPPSVDLRAFCTRVEDQGLIGSCSANVVVGALEFHRKKANMDPSDLSRLFVYYNTRRLRGDVENDTGATLAEAMAAALAYGAPRAELWPYVEDNWAEEPPEEAYVNAQLNEAVSYARVSPGVGVLAAVAAGFPISFGMFAPKLAFDFAGATGEMPELTAAQWTLPHAPGHAMLVVGYDLLRRLYLVRNSWSEFWGDGGYAWIPFSVMDRAAFPESFWMIGQLEQAGGVEVRPVATESASDRLRGALRGELEANVADVRAGIRDRLTRR